MVGARVGARVGLSEYDPAEPTGTVLVMAMVAPPLQKKEARAVLKAVWKASETMVTRSSPSMSMCTWGERWVEGWVVVRGVEG